VKSPITVSCDGYLSESPGTSGRHQQRRLASHTAHGHEALHVSLLDVVSIVAVVLATGQGGRQLDLLHRLTGQRQ
jgi:hypothetical protein